ncbi:MAG: hypothetical protein HY586_08135 [Candidatus Omnitrophica bacterium]|nr:hypothetical protein [Candidatus Omnitrophota bacterium]
MNHFTAGVVLFFSIAILAFSGYAQTKPEEQALPRDKYLVRSGVAHDAHEDIFGLITIDDPKNFFTPAAPQLTWWGEFKPFTSWGRPKLHAEWLDPDGEVIAAQDFKGLHCRLAKTTLKVGQANVNLREGKWEVRIYMKGKLLDRKNFVVFDPLKPPAQAVPETVPTVTIVGADQEGGVQL